MRKTLILIFSLLFSSVSIAEKIEVEKRDYIRLIVSSYVNGFNEFDTSVTTFNDSVSIGIYYDISTQKEERANQLAQRFRSKVPAILAGHEWAKNVKVKVNVYSEDKTGRGY